MKLKRQLVEHGKNSLISYRANARKLMGDRASNSLTRAQATLPERTTMQKKVADQVAVLWATRGYKVTQSFAGELGYEVFATNKGMSDLSFGANFRAMSLLGGSECVDGNVTEILEKLPKPTTGLEDRD